MFLIPSSDSPFYLWQCLVQMHKLRGQEAQWLFYCSDEMLSPGLRKIMDSGIANITVWPDWERDRQYNAAMKPWLVGKWLSAEGYMGPVTVIDPDVIPTGQPLPGPQPGVLLGTDTDSYTGPAWLDSKGALEPLCALVGVQPDKARAYLGVGAQLTFAGIPGEWWENVARLSIDAYALLKGLPQDAQPWCAEMYVTWLAGIRDGYLPTISPAMSMVWANGPASGWDTCGFFHDAGVQEPTPGVFRKNDYMAWPVDIPDINTDLACYRYTQMIRKTQDEFPHLVDLLKQ